MSTLDIFHYFKGNFEMYILISFFILNKSTFSYFSITMVVDVPFVQWVYVTQRSKLSIGRSFYYLETTDNQKEIVATVAQEGFTTIMFKASQRFLQDYREVLPLGEESEWNSEDRFTKWLDAIIYHSFLLYSSPGKLFWSWCNNFLMCLFSYYFPFKFEINTP